MTAAMNRPATADLATDVRTAFRHHPAGVALITAAGGNGPVGLTASSVTTVTVDPPTLAFSVMQASGSAGRILTADTLLVHLLDSRHAGLAREFALPGGRRFTADQGWTTLTTGEPHLAGARAALRCRIVETVPVGTAVLVVAQVLDVHPGESADPMTYHDRAFRRTGATL